MAARAAFAAGSGERVAIEAPELGVGEGDVAGAAVAEPDGEPAVPPGIET